MDRFAKMWNWVRYELHYLTYSLSGQMQKDIDEALRREDALKTDFVNFVEEPLEREPVEFSAIRETAEPEPDVGMELDKEGHPEIVGLEDVAGSDATRVFPNIPGSSLIIPAAADKKVVDLGRDF